MRSVCVCTFLIHWYREMYECPFHINDLFLLRYLGNQSLNHFTDVERTANWLSFQKASVCQAVSVHYGRLLWVWSFFCPILKGKQVLIYFFPSSVSEYIRMFVDMLMISRWECDMRWLSHIIIAGLRMISIRIDMCVHTECIFWSVGL